MSKTLCICPRCEKQFYSDVYGWKEKFPMRRLCPGQNGCKQWTQLVDIDLDMSLAECQGSRTRVRELIA